MADGADERRIALVVREWGHQSTLYAWIWCKQYLFRRGPDGTLDPRDTFFIVKAGREEGDRWKVGGPLIPDLDTATAEYPNTVVKLDGSLQSNVKAYIEQYRPDILVMGDNLPSPALKLTSSSEYVKQSLPVPFVLIRPEAVRNVKLRLSTHDHGHGHSGFGSVNARREMSPERTEETPAMTGRRIAISYPTFAVGRGLMQFVRDKLLTPNDTVYITHTFARDNAMNAMKQQFVTGGKKFVRAMTLNLQQQQHGGGEVTEDSALEFGAKELEGFKVHLNVVLKGDPKNTLPAFCEKEAIDLLVIGSRTGGLGTRIRKTLGGGSVSSHLIDSTPCPCLVIPHKYLGLVPASDSLDEEALSPTASLPLSPAHSPFTFHPDLPAEGVVAETLAAPAGAGSHSTPSDILAVLQQQLAEKDRVIAELRAEVQQLRLSRAQDEARAMQDPASSLNL